MFCSFLIEPLNYVYIFVRIDAFPYRKVITAWSSGTGSAGPIGSLLYAGITHLGIPPRDTVRIMLFVPAIQAISFWILLQLPSEQIDNKNCVKNIAIIELNDNAPAAMVNAFTDVEVKLHGVKAKLKFIPKLAGFIAPLVIVFIFEYICVSGLVCVPFSFHKNFNQFNFHHLIF